MPPAPTPTYPVAVSKAITGRPRRGRTVPVLHAKRVLWVLDSRRSCGGPPVGDLGVGDPTVIRGGGPISRPGRGFSRAGGRGQPAASLATMGREGLSIMAVGRCVVPVASERPSSLRGG